MSTTTVTPASPTTPAEPAEAVSEPQGAPEAVAQGNERNIPPTSENDDRDETGRYLSQEAAKYRRRLRDTEVERDSLREQLDRLQTTEVERLAAAAGLAMPGDVWQFGASLETLRGEDGAIDADTVNALAADIVKDRPGLARQPVGDLGGGRGGAASGRGPRLGLSALLKP